MREDPQQTELFKQYVKQNSEEFAQIYQAQRAETRKRIEEERRLIAERKAALIKQQELDKINSRFKNRQQHGSNQSLGQDASDISRPMQRDNINSMMQFSSQGEHVDNRNSSADINTETSLTARQSRDGLQIKPHILEEPSAENLHVIVDIASAGEDEEGKSEQQEIDIHEKIEPIDQPMSNRGLDEDDIVKP